MTSQSPLDDTPLTAQPTGQSSSQQMVARLVATPDTPTILTMISAHQPTTVAPTSKQKFLAKFGFGTRHDIALDMDVGCGCYDGQGNLLESVWYGKVRAFDGAVRLTYDTFIGMNKLYTPLQVEEELNVRLLHLPKEVQTLVLFVHCHGNYPLKKLTVGKVGLKVSDHHSIDELSLAECADDVAGMAVWQISRDGDAWQVWAINEPVTGDTIGNMATHWQIKTP